MTLASAWWLLLGVWALLLAGRAAAGTLGLPWAVLLSFAAATALVLLVRPRGATATPQPTQSRRRRIAVASLAVLSGASLYPAQHAVALWLGGVLGLTEVPPGASFLWGLWGGPPLWLSLLVLAPIFEETLYRRRLFDPLRARFGAPLAVALTSLLFALPHVDPWSVLGAFVVGIGLGTLMAVTGSLAVCMGLHAGLNLAVLVGLGSFGVVPAVPGVLIGGGLLTTAVWILRQPARTHAVGSLRPAYSVSSVALVVTVTLAAIALFPDTAPVSAPREAVVPLDEAEAPPDYGRPDTWAAHPRRIGLADLTLPGITSSGGLPRADVFFVHPTTYIGSEVENQALGNEGANAITDHIVLPNQASIFNACCRVFAPRYRQASRGTVLGDSDESTKARELAYAGVESAFLHYLAGENRGRPILLAGHGQGAYHALRLLADHVSGSRLREQLVAAYLVGFPVLEDWRRRKISDIPICSSHEETGCVASWNTVSPHVDLLHFAEPVRAYYGVDAEGGEIACVNPLSWKVEEERAPATMNRGSVLFAKLLGVIGFTIGNAADAACREGLLVVEDIDFRLRLTGGRDGDYHLLDYGLFYMNVRENSLARVDAFVDSYPALRERNSHASTAAPPSVARTQAY